MADFGPIEYIFAPLHFLRLVEPLPRSTEAVGGLTVWWPNTLKTLVICVVMAWRAHITMRILLHFLYTACLLSYFSKFSSSIRVTIGVRMTEWRIDRMQVSSRCQLFVQWGTQWTRPPWWMECGMFRCSTSSYIYTHLHIKMNTKYWHYDVFLFGGVAIKAEALPLCGG